KPSTLTRLSAPLSRFSVAQRTFSSTPISRFSNSSFKMGVTLIKSEKEWEELVEKSNEPVVVDFFATWCGPCKAVAPMVEKMSDSHTSVKFYKVDVDELSEVAGNNGISAMPTFLFYKDGQRIDDLTVRGAQPKAIEQAVLSISA
ncbi:Thioredoxin, partial [Penicillium cataractarum]